MNPHRRKLSLPFVVFSVPRYRRVVADCMLHFTPGWTTIGTAHRVEMAWPWSVATNSNLRLSIMSLRRSSPLPSLLYHTHALDTLILFLFKNARSFACCTLGILKARLLTRVPHVSRSSTLARLSIYVCAPVSLCLLVTFSRSVFFFLRLFGRPCMSSVFLVLGLGFLGRGYVRVYDDTNTLGCLLFHVVQCSSRLT